MQLMLLLSSNRWNKISVTEEFDTNIVFSSFLLGRRKNHERIISRSNFALEDSLNAFSFVETKVKFRLGNWRTITC